MCEATGNKVKKDNFMMHDKKWKNNQIVEAPMNMIMNEEKIRLINVKNSVKKLGTCIS